MSKNKRSATKKVPQIYYPQKITPTKKIEFLQNSPNEERYLKLQELLSSLRLNKSDALQMIDHVKIGQGIIRLTNTNIMGIKLVKIKSQQSQGNKLNQQIQANGI